MNELSLFSGAGGGLLGTHLLGFNHVGYVEIDDYCQRVIAQRIKDGYLNDAPIFSDIETFISEGYALSYKGMVDVITAGFVCTDVSVANRDYTGTGGERTGATWQFTADCIRIIRPAKVLLENSPAILVRGFERVANDLSAMGYGFRWGVLGTNHLGGLHERKRWFCVATDTTRVGLEGWDSSIAEREAAIRPVQTLGKNKIRVDIPCPDAHGRNNDSAYRMDRLKALGNMQSPIVVKAAWEILNEM